MFLVLNFVGARLVVAQVTGNADAAATAKVREKVSKIGKGKKVVVIVRSDNSRRKGVVKEIDGDSFTVTDKETGAETRFEYSQVKKVSRAGLPVGAKIAIIAGIAVPVVIALTLLRIRLCNEGAC